MALHNKIQLTIIITVPPEHVDEGDRIFHSHAPWMDATHYREGNKALLSYSVSKAAELSNPMDLSSPVTGNTCFVLSEIYETEEGVSDHFQQAMDSWKDFPAFCAWLDKCKVVAVPVAPIINSLW